MRTAFIPIILLTSMLITAAQVPVSALFTYYDEQNYAEIEKQLQTIGASDPPSIEIAFFRALFLESGEEAKEQFQHVFENSKGKVKSLAAKKLMDYYYARGLYTTAAGYHEFLTVKEPDAKSPTVSTPPERREQPAPKSVTVSENYFVQVGAFSLPENADQLQKMLATQNIESKIVERMVENKKLYCVWLNGAESFEETLKYANTIKEKYDLRFRIIKQ